MGSSRDVQPGKLVAEIGKELKDKLQMPEWAKNAKTGMGKERLPENEDWWYLRAASVLRKVYIGGPVGVNRLRTYYGNRHRRGHKPSHFAEGAGKIIRVILQDLEKINMVKKIEKPKKGRVITPEGQKFIDGIAKKLK